MSDFECPICGSGMSKEFGNGIGFDRYACDQLGCCGEIELDVSTRGE
jgi:hypothetical protein